MTDTGWFADIDEDATEPSVWQPFLQLPGHVVPAEIWFSSEEDCLRFIRSDILGKGMLE